MAPNNGDVLWGAPVKLILVFIFILSCVDCIVHYSKQELLALSPVFSGIDERATVHFDESFFISSLSSQNINNQDGRQTSRPRKRGKRGGVLVRSRQKFSKTPLPSLILANVNRLHNKFDDFLSRFPNDNDFKNSQVICLTETWLTENHNDNLLKPPGFSVHRCDRDRKVTGKDDGGGVAMVINDSWCTNVTTISKGCTRNLEHISLKCRPFYLPREFSSVTITGIYIHPHADVKDALHDLSNIISKYENNDPDTVLNSTRRF